MEDEVLKGSFDAVILGTGLVQSILAGALAFHGKKIIHIDKNDFYGEYTSSHTIDGFPTSSVKEDTSPAVCTQSVDGSGSEEEETKAISLPTKSLPGLNVLSISHSDLKKRQQEYEVCFCMAGERVH